MPLSQWLFNGLALSWSAGDLLSRQQLDYRYAEGCGSTRPTTTMHEAVAQMDVGGTLWLRCI